MRNTRETIDITVTSEEKTLIERRATQGGWKSTAAYIRDAALKYNKDQDKMKEAAHTQIAEVSRKTYHVLEAMRRQRLFDDNPIEQILSNLIKDIDPLL